MKIISKSSLIQSAIVLCRDLHAYLISLPLIIIYWNTPYSFYLTIAAALSLHEGSDYLSTQSITPMYMRLAITALLNHILVICIQIYTNSYSGDWRSIDTEQPNVGQNSIREGVTQLSYILIYSIYSFAKYKKKYFNIHIMWLLIMAYIIANFVSLLLIYLLTKTSIYHLIHTSQ